MSEEHNQLPPIPNNYRVDKLEWMDSKLEWIDSESATWTQWNWVWEQIQPLSMLGKECKTSIKPFVKGEEQLWQVEIKQMQALEQLVIQQEKRERLETAFQHLVNPRLFLQLLKKGDCGTELDWFDFKQFLWNTRIIFQQLRTLDSSMHRSYSIIEELLNLLSPDHNSFSVEEVRIPETIEQERLVAPARQELKLLDLHKLRQEKASRKQQLAQLQEHKRNMVEEDLSVFFHRKPTLYISSKDQSLIQQCLKHPNLLLERETTFESVFSLRMSPEEQELRSEIERLEEQIAEVELKRLKLLAMLSRPYVEDLESWCDWLGLWDWRWAKLRWLGHDNYCWPKYDSEQLMLQQARYLPLEKHLALEGKHYTPISITIQFGLTTLVGSNMGGKSIALKTIGFITTMAHYALPIPAQAYSGPLFNRLVVVSGDQENLKEGLSTFGAEMSRLSHYIHDSDQLLLMDELARGTNPQEGEALAYAIGEYIAHKKDMMGVLITHFSKLSSILQAKHYRVNGLQDNGYMDYQITNHDESGVPHKALLIAQRLGLPQSIIESAKVQMEAGENHGKAALRSNED